VNTAVDDWARQAGITIAALCLRVGMKRQNFYAERRRRKRSEIDEDLIVKLVLQIRRLHPRMGGRKLLCLLRPQLAEAGVRIGRDRFFGVLRRHGLLVERKRTSPRTTQSRHTLPVFCNLVAGLALTAPDQVWVSDLTYIRTDEGFVYAAVVMDRWSRKIVGAHIGDSLEADGCVRALKQALVDLPADRHPIHHSDRGSQYCCHAYVDCLQSRRLPISMTETNHCYENAHAERVIGILKQEYELDATFRTKEDAYRSFSQAIELYNHYRPHLSLDYDTPARVHGRVA
jgi:transposase InsO family protein